MNIVEIAKASASKWIPAPPASGEILLSLRQKLSFELPYDYLDFLRFSNGGCGDIPVDPWCFDGLWKAEELAECNRDYQVLIYCPGFLALVLVEVEKCLLFKCENPNRGL